MSEELKNQATEILTPKVAVFFTWIISFLTNGAAWYVEWIYPIVATLISIFSIVLIFTGIRLNITNNKKVKLDIQNIERENKELRDKLNELDKG